MTYAVFVHKVINDFVEKSIIPVIVGIAVVYFLWGGYKFIQSAGDAKGREEGKKRLMYGLIGLAVMVSVWGLVKILAGTIGGDVSIPQF